MSSQPPNPVVSILLPAFNAGRYLSDAIDSIRQQTLREWELIVIDNGSTDATADLAAGFAERDPRIRLLREPARGIVRALDAGIAQARAPLIARMDCDDRCHAERLERQVAWLEQCPDIGVVTCKARLIGETEQSGGLQRYVQWVNALETSEAIAQNRFIDAPVLHPTVCFRRELVESHGSYRDGDFPEDYELWLRWMEAGVRFGQLPEVLFEWRDHPVKLTRTDPRYREEALWQMKGQYLHRWFRKHLDLERPLWIWGAGRRTRSRLKYLEWVLQETPIRAFIDVDPRKIGQRIEGIPVVAPSALGAHPHAFVLGMVGSVGARDQIRAELESRGRREGQDFLFVA